ncbi:hypothetical protein CDD81_2944 [Ophiocordyceps australis]|uniref:Vacuolar iron transporter Ccc1 n=1 Tax=Ophiocordyceps australis TaxID=1399860 RepID=A0A2C5YCD8_9HYPO|nr:hypothetical protein CDD81_2944 [Ophiocordyceps australis]
MARRQSPYLTRFLSDFTLGFSDGLTVPFALTAGLSSLGRADTVIYAGLAELCAGSISMGIGGYLAAVDELPQTGDSHDTELGQHQQESWAMLPRHSSVINENDSDKDESTVAGENLWLKLSGDAHLIRCHLEPLALADSAVADVMAALRRQPGALAHAAQQLRMSSLGTLSADGLPVWPVASGCSISLGYVIGGVIPLMPYFFAATVGTALCWSVGLCLVALMVFGSAKCRLLRTPGGTSWRRCLRQGFKMMVLGGLAAAAAVLCVNLVGAASTNEPS